MARDREIMGYTAAGKPVIGTSVAAVAREIGKLEVVPFEAGQTRICLGDG